MSKQAPTPYPKLPDIGHPHFWLAAFFRDAAQLEQITLLQRRPVSTKDAKDEKVYGSQAHIRRDALIWSELLIHNDVQKAIGYVVDEGLLPYAWQGTKVLQGAAA